MIKPTAFLLPLSATLFLSSISCGSKSNPNYDTPKPGYENDLPSASQAPNPNPEVADVAGSAHPTYGQAAYQDNSTMPSPPQVGSMTPPANPSVNLPATPTAAPDLTNARSHYVAPGDSLWKIASQYKVPIASIKAANNMTTDTVVLGKKLIIPAQ